MISNHKSTSSFVRSRWREECWGDDRKYGEKLEKLLHLKADMFYGLDISAYIQIIAIVSHRCLVLKSGGKNVTNDLNLVLRYQKKTTYH